MTPAPRPGGAIICGIASLIACKYAGVTDNLA
jgi:hypothetical protein